MQSGKRNNRPRFKYFQTFPGARHLNIKSIQNSGRTSFSLRRNPHCRLSIQLLQIVSSIVAILWRWKPPAKRARSRPTCPTCSNTHVGLLSARSTSPVVATTVTTMRISPTVNCQFSRGCRWLDQQRAPDIGAAPLDELIEVLGAAVE